LKYAAHDIHFGDVLRATVFTCCLSVLYILAARYVVLTIHWWRQEYRPPAQVRHARTVVLALASGGIVCFLYGLFIEPYRPEITNVAIPNAHIRPGTSLRIVHISDLHSEQEGRFQPKMRLSCARSTKVLLAHNPKVGGSNPPRGTSDQFVHHPLFLLDQHSRKISPFA
jgi:hypothetical protein